MMKLDVFRLETGRLRRCATGGGRALQTDSTGHFEE